MSITGIYFSPTGTTRDCVKMVAKGMGDSLTLLDLTLPSKEGDAAPGICTDAVIIAAPVYGGRIPALFAKRIASLDGRGTPAILLCNYGNRHYDDALVELADMAQAAGFVPVAAIATVSQHSFSWKIATGRPDAADEEKLVSFGALAAKKLAEGNQKCPEFPGNRPYKEFKFNPIVPFPDDQCLRCLHCVGVCPAGAINPQNPEAVDAGKCISCHACIKGCSIRARKTPEAFAAAQQNMVNAFGQPRREPEWWL